MSSSGHKKPKLVRDRFTIPKSEYAAIDALKMRAVAMGTWVKKSELLRAGLMVLQGLNDAAYKRALATVPDSKAARPAADKSATRKRASTAAEIPAPKAATPVRKTRAAPKPLATRRAPAPPRKKVVTRAPAKS